MSYLDRMKWTALRTDLQTGFREGMVALKKGTMVARKRADEVTEEGLHRHKLIALKVKMHNLFSDLGVRVYSLIAAKGGKNPATDTTVKDITAQLKRYDAEISLLEKTLRKLSKRRTRKAA
ncbi:MAG TPA: hypothetical protein VEI57_00740 [Nitrospirota bacterium]|nr:hypothetical protein [Nitrospirota bacterium]